MKKRLSGPQYFGHQLRKSFVDEGDHPSPGPAANNPITPRQNNPPYWSLGKSQQRDSFLDKYHRAVPSPDKYDTDIDATQTSHPNFAIPRYQQELHPNKIDAENSLNYSPDFSTSKQKFPNYSFSYRYDRDYSTISPAPNSYSLNLKDRQSHNMTQRSFGIGLRPEPYGQQAKYPHAAKYNINRHLGGEKHLIGNSQRPVVRIGQAPGLFYNISGNLYQNSKGKSLGKHIQLPKNKDIQIFPAPNKYLPSLAKSNRSIINYNGPRSQIMNTAVVNNPSPNKYEPQIQKSYQTISFTLGEKQLPDHTVIPGVGTYNIQSKLEKILGTMGIRHKKIKQFINPSPSNYDPKQTLIRSRSKSPINFNSERYDFSKSITGIIGPGDYQVQKKSLLQNGKMGKSAKFQPQRNRNPGPGSYQIGNGIGNLPKYVCPLKKLTQSGFSRIQIQRKQRLKLLKQRQKTKDESLPTKSQEGK